MRMYACASPVGAGDTGGAGGSSGAEGAGGVFRRYYSCHHPQNRVPDMGGVLGLSFFSSSHTWESQAGTLFFGGWQE